MEEEGHRPIKCVRVHDRLFQLGEAMPGGVCSRCFSGVRGAHASRSVIVGMNLRSIYSRSRPH